MNPRPFVACVLLLGAAASGASIAACGGASAAGPSPDAGPDAVVPVPGRPHAEAGPDEPFDAGVSRWCSAQGKHSFCADFDGHDLLEGWRAISSDFNPTFEVAPSDRSPPRAFLVKELAASRDAGQFPESFALTKTFSVASPSSIRIALDLNVEALGLETDTFAISPIMLALTRTEGNSTSYNVAAQLSIRPTRTEIHVWGADPDGGFGPSESTTIAPLPLASWVHVELELKSAPSGGSATITYDGKAAGTLAITGAATSDLNGAYLEIGARDAQYHPRDTVMTFDSVIADVK